MKCVRGAGERPTYSWWDKHNKEYLKKFGKRTSCFVCRRKQCLNFMLKLRQKNPILCDTNWAHLIHNFWWVEKKRWQ